MKRIFFLILLAVMSTGIYAQPMIKDIRKEQGTEWCYRSEFVTNRHD